MFHSEIEIVEGALFITDAHYNKPKGERDLERLFEEILSKKIAPPQIFLLGDIFDALFGGVPYTAKENRYLIEMIEACADFCEVIYLEGNHDFQLRSFFSPKIKIFPLSKQPVVASAKGKKVCLAHGDYDAPIGYRLYTAFIRNKTVLFCLNIYDSLTNHSILRFVENHMQKKEQCKKFAWFDSFVKKRVEKGMECDIYIDGHFHQNKRYDFKNISYYNLAAFACNQRYFVVKYLDNELKLEEKRLSKG